MRKYNVRSAARKLLCLILSVFMTTGSLVSAVSAASAETAVEFASSGSPVMLSFGAGNLELADTGRSMRIQLRLTQEEELIRQRIYREDIVLGGVFRDMIVSDVRNDRKTILLELIGVPDLAGDGASASLEGTMEFPGELFGCDESVEVSVGVTGKEEIQEDSEPSFRPYADAMRVNGDVVEMNIVLLPTRGEFAGDFSADDVSFARGLKDAKILRFGDAGNGCREITVSIPKEGMKAEEDGLSCFGSIILSGNSMVSPGGKAYGDKLSSVREYSVEMAGRDQIQDDINSMKNDTRAIKDFVDLFGDTSFATIGKTAYGGFAAASAGYTMLSLVGILPSSSGSVKIMETLQDIRQTLDQVSEKCDYMTGVLDSHTKMLTDMGVKLDEQYLGGFNAEFGSMVDAMDLLQDEITNPWVSRQIEEAIATVAAKYQTVPPGTGRGFDEDFDVLLLDPGYDEYDDILSEDWYAVNTDDIDIFGEMASDPEYYEYDNLFGDDDDDVEFTDDFTWDDTAEQAEEEAAAAEDTVAEEITEEEDAVIEEAEEDEAEAAAIEEAAAVEETTEEEDMVEAAAVEEAEEEEDMVEAASWLEELLHPGEDSTEEEEPQPERDGVMALQFDFSIFDKLFPKHSDDETDETEPAEERILDEYETQMYLMDLNREIGKIGLTANITIGDLLRKIASDYSTLSRRFDTNDNSNPIVAFCNAHEGTDNFATTSWAEKELYKQNVRYQFSRALTILSAMDSPTAYKRAITNLQNKDTQNTWPDPGKGNKDGKGNPYCYLTQSYVRLATQSEIDEWYDPLKRKNKEKVQITNQSNQNVSIEEFYRRMHGRTLERELALAEVTNLKAIREDGFNGITFSFERWGVKYGYRKYTRNYYAWTDSVRYAEPDSVYDHVNYGGQLLRNDDSYIIVATPYIRWTSLGDVPAQCYLYQDSGDQQRQYRLSTLVKP